MTIFLKKDNGKIKTFAEIEKELFEQMNILFNGNISKIATALKIQRTRVYRKFKLYNIKIEKPIRIIKKIDLRQVSVGENGDLSVRGVIEETEFSQRIGLNDLPLQESINIGDALVLPKTEFSQAVGPADILPSEVPALPENAMIIKDHLSK